MLVSWLPFAAALLLLLLAPAIDQLWKRSFRRFYESLPIVDIKTPQHLLSAATWATDIAQAVPSTVLTLIGISLLISDASTGIFGAVMVMTTVLMFIPVILVATDTEHLHDYAERRCLLWTRLQLLQMATNALGIMVATGMAPAT